MPVSIGFHNNQYFALWANCLADAFNVKADVSKVDKARR
jgi:hypothetical protein